MARALGLDPAPAQYAAAPDAVADVCLGRLGTHVLGHSAAGLMHFTSPTASGHMRGYSWRMDASIPTPLRTLDLPLGDVTHRPDRWLDLGVSSAASAAHPLAALLRDLTGKAPLDADALTFPSSAVLAAWLERLPHGPVRTGCLCHLAQDLCIPHHVRGYLLRGHQEYEAAAHVEWCRRRCTPVVSPGQKSLGMRQLLERLASSEPSRSVAESVDLAVQATADVLLACA